LTNVQEFLLAYLNKHAAVYTWFQYNPAFASLTEGSREMITWEGTIVEKRERYSVEKINDY